MVTKIEFKLKNVEKMAQPIYEIISPQKRLKLYIEAKAMGNDEEVQQLKNSCPRKNYTMCDADMLDLKEAFNSVLFMTETLIFHLLHKYHVVKIISEALVCHERQSQRCMLLGFMEGWQAAGGHNDESRDMILNKFKERTYRLFEFSELAEYLETLKKQYQTSIMSHWEAFGEICRDLVGVKPETALGVYGGLEALKGFSELLNSGAQADPDECQELIKIMRELWTYELRKMQPIEGD